MTNQKLKLTEGYWQGRCIAHIILFCFPSHPGGGHGLGPGSCLVEVADPRGSSAEWGCKQLQAEMLDPEELLESREERKPKELPPQCGQD